MSAWRSDLPAAVGNHDTHGNCGIVPVSPIVPWSVDLLSQVESAKNAAWSGRAACDGCTLRSENRGCTDCSTPMRNTGKLPRTSLANRSPTTVPSFPRARPATEVGQSIRAPRELSRSPRLSSYPQRCQEPSRPTGSWHFFFAPHAWLPRCGTRRIDVLAFLRR